MNKFMIVSCVELDKSENGYGGPAIVLGCVADPLLVLFFPIPQDKAEMLNYLLKEGDYNINTESIGLYKTMLDSWMAGNRFLSGIILDCIYDEETDDEIMNVEFVLSNRSSGLIESVVPVSFVNSMILAAMQGLEVIVTMKLLDKLLPDDDDDEDEEDNNEEDVEDNKSAFPEDNAILDIVKGIMDGKLDQNLSLDNSEGPSCKKTPSKKKSSSKTSSKTKNTEKKEKKEPKKPE